MKGASTFEMYVAYIVSLVKYVKLIIFFLSCLVLSSAARNLVEILYIVSALCAGCCVLLCSVLK